MTQPGPQSPTPATRRPVIFYTPHADDETLAMGASIEKHLTTYDRDVHLVLLTDGAASAARTALANEGYPLTTEEFVAARERELTDAAARLGVLPDHVHFERLPDQGVTEANATATVDKYIAQYPTAGHHGMSWLDNPGDHATFGAALREMTVQGQIPGGDARFYLHLQNRAKRTGTRTVIAASAEQRCLAAAAAYRLFAPEQGRYAVGFHSSPWAFDAYDRDSSSFVHPL